MIDVQGRRLGILQSQMPIQLLDLRNAGAMHAGSVAALSSCAYRALSQEWSRSFHATYPQIDGMIYSSAHNEEAAVALYVRAEEALRCIGDLLLNEPSLRSRILQVSQEHGMVMKG